MLRRHRLVVSERRGSHVYYRLSDPAVAQLLTAARELLLSVLSSERDLLRDARELPIIGESA